MQIRIATVVLAAACAAAAAAAQQPLPIEKEPMHRLKLENEYVRVFDVLIPRGRSSLFHTHIYDGLSVRVSDTKVSEEMVGSANVTTEIKRGEVSYGTRPSPMTHRVSVTGKADFRNIFIELLPSKRSVPATALGPFPEGLVKLLDNERVRVSRRDLAPGASTTPHTHPMDGLGVVLSDAKVEITPAGGTPRVMEVKAGDVVWQAAGTSHTIKNVGQTPFQSVEVEIK